MKKEYIIPAIEVVAAQLDQEMMAGHSLDEADAKQQTFENEETFFNRDTKNIWETEEGEE